jgi:F-type H+-transporting ATPase subunit epsilon
MVGFFSGVFRVVLLTPHGRLLDCRAGSVVLPGHDGQLGILRNHAPMLIKLGVGLMRVEGITGRSNAYFVVDGGFVRVSENNVTILAYDVTTFEGMDKETANEMFSRARSVVHGGGYIRQIDEMDVKKASLIVKMGQMALIDAEA